MGTVATLNLRPQFNITMILMNGMGYSFSSYWENIMSGVKQVLLHFRSANISYHLIGGGSYLVLIP